LCYYIGGTEDAATSLLRTISQSVKNFLPADKICEQLKKKDNEICSVRWGGLQEKKVEPLDLSTADFDKMKIKDLKKILSQWNESCPGCTEKQDFVKQIKTLAPKYAAKKDL